MLPYKPFKPESSDYDLSMIVYLAMVLGFIVLLLLLASIADAQEKPDYTCIAYEYGDSNAPMEWSQVNIPVTVSRGKITIGSFFEMIFDPEYAERHSYGPNVSPDFPNGLDTIVLDGTDTDGDRCVVVLLGEPGSNIGYLRVAWPRYPKLWQVYKVRESPKKKGKTGF